MKRPGKPCIEPGCPRLATRNSRCDEHAPTHAAERNTHWNRKHNGAYHTTDYRKARTICIARWHYQCALDTCHAPDSLTVHHIDHNTANNQQANLVCLCTSCHMKLEAEYQRGNLTGPVHTALARALT